MSDEIGTRVKKVRLRKGISQEQFGEIIGIKKQLCLKLKMVKTVYQKEIY